MQTDLTPAEVRQRAANALVTMDTLYREAGISPTTFWRWERGMSKPSLLVLAKLRRTLESLEP
jgi:DNA-binding XRE family transcriptional regulator